MRRKITDNFHFVRRPSLFGLPPSPRSNSASNPWGGGGGSLPFSAYSALFSTHPSRSLFRIISFESTIMGCREHAGHVFAKVCAPNTKAAWQTGSIPRVAGRRHTTTTTGSWTGDILRVLWLADRSFYLPSCARCRVRGGGGKGRHPTS